MRIYFYILGIGLFLTSCAENPSASCPSPVAEHHSESTRVLSIGIKGMECMQACGESIKAAFASNDAILDIDFDFESDRLVNTALVFFNNEEIEAEDITATIAGLNDGQYQVITSKVKAVNAVCPHMTTDQSSSKDVNVGYSSGVEIPNFFELFSDLL